VGHFLASGIEAGDRIIVIATDEHRESFTRHLRSRELSPAPITFLGARETLSRFMLRGMPDAACFRELIAQILAGARDGGHEKARIRAYGEMVDLLWREGNSRGAIRLEELWNEAGQVHEFSLLCAYVMGNFYKEGASEHFLDVCRNHSHVLPTEKFAELPDLPARLREISILQQRARGLEEEIRQRKEIELALREALEERSRIAEELRVSLAREHAARTEAEANNAFREMFLGILGHDLRNPLNTVLTTARLMERRSELPVESRSRFARIITSGVRMQRMIDQLLDLTRARVAGGIAVNPIDERDLVSLVTKIADEVRVAHPGRAIEVRAEGSCPVRLDADRFEQVVSNLLGNAIAHGDNRRILVTVGCKDLEATVSVHNFGAPIEPAFMPLLFDPFRKTDRPRGRSNGLGLGLYISERIITGHGGRIDVQSSESEGTRFEVTIPRGT
jgi:signal transduction histidine kinase